MVVYITNNQYFFQVLKKCEVNVLFLSQFLTKNYKTIFQ